MQLIAGSSWLIASFQLLYNPVVLAWRADSFSSLYDIGSKIQRLLLNLQFFERKSHLLPSSQIRPNPYFEYELRAIRYPLSAHFPSRIFLSLVDSCWRLNGFWMNPSQPRSMIWLAWPLML